MKIGATQIIIGLILILGIGGLAVLVSQKSTNIESKYKEIIDVFALADEVGLDKEQFKKDIDSEEVHKVVADDKAEAEQRLNGQISTPSIFIDGELFNSGGATVQDLLESLRTSLQAKVDNGEKPLLEEYFDFNCIHCADVEKGMNQIAADLGDKVTYEKKYLPFLRTSSTTYAYAAEAANRQGKLREYSELLFEKIHGI